MAQGGSAAGILPHLHCQGAFPRHTVLDGQPFGAFDSRLGTALLSGVGVSPAAFTSLSVRLPFAGQGFPHHKQGIRIIPQALVIQLQAPFPDPDHIGTQRRDGAGPTPSGRFCLQMPASGRCRPGSANLQDPGRCRSTSSQQHKAANDPGVSSSHHTAFKTQLRCPGLMGGAAVLNHWALWPVSTVTCFTSVSQVLLAPPAARCRQAAPPSC